MIYVKIHEVVWVAYASTPSHNAISKAMISDFIIITFKRFKRCIWCDMSLSCWRRKDSATCTVSIMVRSVPPPVPHGLPGCIRFPMAPNPCEADSKSPPRSASTTSSCKKLAITQVIAQKQITTYADQKVATRRNSGIILGVIMQEPGKNGKKVSPSSRYTILETVMNPEPLAITRTSPSIQRK